MVAFAICTSGINPNRTEVYFLLREQCWDPEALLGPSLRVDCHLVLAGASYVCSLSCDFSHIFGHY